MLRRVAVFAGPFTTTAARAVAGGDPAEVDRAVRVLARDNLLRVERTATTLSFRMLRTVRDLALEELSASGEVPLTRSRHRRWFAGIWRDAPLSDALVEHVGRTYDDHLEALAMALEVGDDPAAADLTTTLSRRWQFVETPGPGLHWTAVALVLPGVTTRQRARLRVARAGFLQAADWGPAEHARLAADLDGDPDWGTLLALICRITAYGEGDTVTAAPGSTRPSSLARSGAPHHVAEVVATRAVVDGADGRADEALAGAHEAMALVGLTSSAVQLVTVVPKVAIALLESAGRARPSTCSRPPRPTPAPGSACARPARSPRTPGGRPWRSRNPRSRSGGSARRSWGRRRPSGPTRSARRRAVPAPRWRRSVTRTPAEVLGLGVWLHTDAGQALPPALDDRVRRASDAVGPASPPSGWTPDLVVARVTQLVRGT